MWKPNFNAVEEKRKNKDAVAEIHAIQREREIETQVVEVKAEYNVDEDTARRFVKTERGKERQKARVAKRNATLKNMGTAIGTGFKKMAEAQQQATKKEEEKEKEEVVEVPANPTKHKKRKTKNVVAQKNEVVAPKEAPKEKEKRIQYGRGNTKHPYFK